MGCMGLDCIIWVAFLCMHSPGRFGLAGWNHYGVSMVDPARCLSALGREILEAIQTLDS